MQALQLQVSAFGPKAAIQLVVLAVVIALGGLYWLYQSYSGGDVVGFKLREADRKRPKRTARLPSIDVRPPASAGAGKTSGTKKGALLLNGIRIDGSPYEVLGLKEKATKAEIQKAYRDLMKRYHPDLVGRPGSREWKDAQLIAEALNKAKDELLKRAS